MAYKNFTLETDADGIALITFDMPGKSMNVIDETVMDDLDAMIDAVAADDKIKGAVIATGKDNFCAGADLTMLQGSLQKFHAQKDSDPEGAAKMLFDGAGRLSKIYRKLETCGKPFVAAIKGVCMGGGLELALACQGRVIADDDKVKISLPEVKVGLFPGAGGTQRVPRLVNAQDALQFLLQGKTVNGTRAKGMGLAHEVVPAKKLIASAKKMLAEGLKPEQPWDVKGFRLPGGAVYSPAGAQLWPAAGAIYRRETYDNYPGARCILKCVYEGLMVPFDTALTIEQRYFTHVMQTTEAAMMIRSLFVSMQELGKGARRPKDVKPNKIKKVGVLGAGFMGAGIAYVTAKAGIEVVLIDQSQEAAEKGKALSDGIVTKGIQRGKASEADKEKLLSLITPTTDYAHLEGCDLVVEAVFEDRDVKKGVTEQAEAVLKPGAIFASNTSTLPISGLAQASKRPKNFIGIHFFSPVDKMMLVEIIMGKKTGDKALAMALDYVRAIKKTPIVVNDTRGFFANRCVLRYMSEAYDMLLEGVPAPMIETSAKMAGMPVGPLSLNDEVAIDLSQKILKAAVKDLGEKAINPEHLRLVNEMVDKHDRRGRKNGKGFYDYPEKPKKKHLWPGLKDLFPSKPADQFDVEELQQRFLVTQALEAARTIEEGVVTDVREADVGSILGFGFAPYTGGTISYIDGMGVANFVALAKKLQKRHGARFKPNKLLLQMAENGETFYGRFNPYRSPDDAKRAA